MQFSTMKKKSFKAVNNVFHLRWQKIPVLLSLEHWTQTLGISLGSSPTNHCFLRLPIDSDTCKGT